MLKLSNCGKLVSENVIIDTKYNVQIFSYSPYQESTDSHEMVLVRDLWKLIASNKSWFVVNSASNYEGLLISILYDTCTNFYLKYEIKEFLNHYLFEQIIDILYLISLCKSNMCLSDECLQSRWHLV